jgi:hypothetical protein
MKYYTYAYLREDGTPYYIGKGKGKRKYTKSGRRISIPKDKNRIITLKQNLTEVEAFRHEKYMISIFGRKDLGTGLLLNMTDGGDGVSGLIHTKKTRKMISKALKNKPLTEETRKKMSEAAKNRIDHPRKGKKHSEETLRKIREAAKGRKHSDETRKKMSELYKGKPSFFKGKKHSEETRKKISERTKEGMRRCKQVETLIDL